MLKKLLISLVLLLPLTANAMELDGTADYDERDKTLYLRGNTVMSQVQKVNVLLASSGISKIVISGDGGLMEAAFSIGTQVRNHDIKVVVDGRCVSACSLIAMSSTKLEMEERGVLYIHSPFIPYIIPTVDVYEYARATVKAQFNFRDYLERLGYHQKFAYYINSRTSPCSFLYVKDLGKLLKWKEGPAEIEVLDRCE